MKQVTGYKCEICGKIFESEKYCHLHELKHLNITEQEYTTWEQLIKNVVFNNDSPDLGEYLNELRVFKKEHNLQNQIIPKRHS